MYAHSFFNSKDLPFLSMFMIALCSVQWAFRQGTVAAFLLCGVAVAILANIRIMGVMLLPAVLAMRACDVYYAAGWGARRRAIISGAAFALAAAGIYYASMPYLWGDPITRFGEMLTVLSRHPIRTFELFRGQYVNASNLPALYLPVWIAITTPVWALLLVAGVALPVIVVIALQSVMSADWRHMYFLWAPLCLLAVVGLLKVGGGGGGRAGLAGGWGAGG